MLLLQAVSLSHSTGDFLFESLNLNLGDREKIAVVGRNGVGKTSLLNLIAGFTAPSSGMIQRSRDPFFLRQISGQPDDRCVDEALGVKAKRIALQRILEGHFNGQDLETLNDDWDIEARCQEVLQSWDLSDLDPGREMSTLSWGQQTRVGLAAIELTQPEFLLLDEPSNHLDLSGRNQLLQLIREFRGALILVSHDRQLLNAMDRICELTPEGIVSYGGNYAFYEAQKNIARIALEDDLRDLEKSLRKARDKERESRERQAKLDARGRKKQEKAGLPTISMNTFRNNAERSSARMKETHAGKVAGIHKELKDLRQEVPDVEQMRLALKGSQKPQNKLIFSASRVQYSFGAGEVWRRPLDLELYSGQRMAITGRNGSGKSTLLQLIRGNLTASQGRTWRSDFSCLYLDQDYSAIDPMKTVSEQAQSHNHQNLERHELNNQLNRFLFSRAFWDRSCSVLSGGEKMRLLLCCLNISATSPDVIMLDEPTNNLDLANLGILEQAISAFEGTLIVVSHDESFLEKIRVSTRFALDE